MKMKSLVLVAMLTSFSTAFAGPGQIGSSGGEVKFAKGGSTEAIALQKALIGLDQVFSCEKYLAGKPNLERFDSFSAREIVEKGAFPSMKGVDLETNKDAVVKFDGINNIVTIRYAITNDSFQKQGNVEIKMLLNEGNQTIKKIDRYSTFEKEVNVGTLASPKIIKSSQLGSIITCK